MQLIYLAPLAWSSFSQRPHMFVRWFHEKFQCPVLWINPYPTRFPQFNDFKRIARSPDACDTPVPDWLTVLSPASIPIEPLPGSQVINDFLWRPLLKRLRDFSSQGKTLIAIGKPSALALKVLNALPDCASLYDAMDDYPQFYQGLSRVTFSRRELQVVKAVGTMMVSSTPLLKKWSQVRADVQLIHNALSPELFLPVVSKEPKSTTPVFGYVGTIAQWFDWDWVIKLAQEFPDARVRLIGPCYVSAPGTLPDNVHLLPACDHASAISAMREFDVGLIPFKQNALTASVDPIKFYEYRALGVPVLSTAFGEMLEHEKHTGVFISGAETLRERAIHALECFADKDLQEKFIQQNNWAARFNKLQIEEWRT